jgi:hypothetical protein
MVKSPSACMVVLQSMWIGPNHCQNFMDSGSESATYLDEVHVDLENVPSEIISPTDGNTISREDSHSKQTMSKFRSRGIYTAPRQWMIR